MSGRGRVVGYRQGGRLVWGGELVGGGSQLGVGAFGEARGLLVKLCHRLTANYHADIYLVLDKK